MTTLTSSRPAHDEKGPACSLDGGQTGFRPDDDLTGAELSGQDLSGVDLAGRDLSGANLDGAILFGADLRGAVLRGASLRRAELTAAHLEGARLDEADLGGATLAGAFLDEVGAFGAHFVETSLTAANLVRADLRAANFRGAILREADLRGADFSQADLREADISESRVEGTDFFRADLRRVHLEELVGFEKARWIGVNLADVNFVGAYRARRFILDQNFIEDFRSANRASEWAYRVWWITSDCGRSMTRWCLWTLAAVLFYAGLFSLVGVDYGIHDTWLSPVYFSVVTLTTLGYGDAAPASVGGQLVAMAAVVTGYLMLGGLLSILSNKMARRGD